MPTPKLTTPADTARALTTNERLLLFCAASDTDWSNARLPGATVTNMMVKGLIMRDTEGRIVPTERGHVVLRALLPNL